MMSFFWEKWKWYMTEVSDDCWKNLESPMYVCFSNVKWKSYGKLRQVVMGEFWQGAMSYEWKLKHNGKWNLECKDVDMTIVSWFTSMYSHSKVRQVVVQRILNDGLSGTK